MCEMGNNPGLSLMRWKQHHTVMCTQLTLVFENCGIVTSQISCLLWDHSQIAQKPIYTKVWGCRWNVIVELQLTTLLKSYISCNIELVIELFISTFVYNNLFCWIETLIKKNLETLVSKTLLSTDIHSRNNTD